MLMFDIVSPKSLKDKENFLRLIESRIIIVENEIYRYQRQLKKSNFGTKIFLLFEFTTESQAYKILEDFRFELEALKKEQIIIIDMINEQRRDRKKECIRVNMRQYNVENIVFQHYLIDSIFYRKDLRTLEVEVALNNSFTS